MSTNDYTKIDNLFTELEKHYTVQSVTNPPFNDNEDSHITDILQCRMDDGKDIEICFWYEGEMHVIEIGVKKEVFNNNEEAYKEYLTEKGLLLHNLEDCTGKWKYAGIIEQNGEFRAQYVSI